MSEWNKKISHFFEGRYGTDTLNMWIVGFSTLMSFLALITRTKLCSVFCLIFLFWFDFRMLSRNIQRREAENQKFEKLIQSVTNIFSRKKNDTQSETHVVFHCPKCGQKVRVPKGKGKISITCPKCSAEFVKRS